MGVRMHQMNARDIPAGIRFAEIAAWNQTRSGWERILSVSPEGCFVAEADGEVVGTAATISYEARFAWMGTVLVDATRRRQEIGTKLLEKAIGYLSGCGVPSIKLDFS